jgi:hypothetical protein
MDVRDLAPALIAVGDLCSRANRVLNGSKAAIEVRVQTGFKPGSFTVDLTVAQAVLEQAKALLLSDNVTAALQLAGLLGLASTGFVNLIRLIKWLRGRKPESVTTLETGEVRIIVRIVAVHRIEVDFQDMVREVEFIDVPQEVAKLYNDPGVRAAAQQIVAPLEKPGIEVFEVRDPDNRTAIERVTREDLPAFAAIAPAEKRITGSEFETVLQIVKPSFDENLKWTFFDGNSNFFADIEDDEFFGEVQRRERKFAKGDLLRVILFVESFISETGQITNVRIVRRVLEQIEPPQQIPLV